MKTTDKRLSPAPTENQRTILASVLARPAGEPIRQHAAAVVATAHSPNNASYNAVWRCVRRGWLSAKRVAKNRVEIYLTGDGVRVLQPNSRAVVAAIGHALRYSDRRDDACDALDAIGYDAVAFAVDIDTADLGALRARLTEGADDVDVWHAVADAIAGIAGRTS